jgi:hypothetical protein
MSAATLLASSQAAAEAAVRTIHGAENTAAIARIKARIYAIEHPTAGIAAKPGTTAPPPSVAAKHAGPALPGTKLIEQVPFLGPTLTAGKAAVELGESVPGELAGKAAGAAAEPIAEGLVGLVQPIALKLTLYAALILGGIALAGYGLATALKPEPPNIKRALGRVAGRAAVAGAMA